MSRENVEVVRRVYDAWNGGDMAALREQLRDAWTGDTLEPVTDFVAAADSVVVRDAWRGTGQGPDADMELSRIFWDHAEALKAVGLPE